jgi:hypothetical protein
MPGNKNSPGTEISDAKTIPICYRSGSTKLRGLRAFARKNLSPGFFPPDAEKANLVSKRHSFILTVPSA